MSIVKNLGGAKRSLRLQAENLKTKIKGDVEAVGRKAVLRAKNLAPVDIGDTAKGINGESINEGFGFRLAQNMAHGVYPEFGTGGKIDIPKGFEEVASQAGQIAKSKDPGNWAQFIENIKDWCRRHGIEESAAYPIARKIYREGIKAQPYLIPAAKEGFQDLLKRLKKYEGRK